MLDQSFFKSVITLVQVLLNIVVLVGYLIAIIPTAYYFPVYKIPGVILVIGGISLSLLLTQLVNKKPDQLEIYNFRMSLLVFVPLFGYIGIIIGLVLTYSRIVALASSLFARSDGSPKPIHKRFVYDKPEEDVIYVESVKTK